jgi:Fe-Mn family superoxide dismutase
MTFTLPKLDYGYNALEPYFDARTMEIHHSKHHQTYVNKLNEALDKAPEFKSKSLEELLTGLDKLPDTVRTAVRNMGGGHYAHTMFWQVIGPPAGTKPSGDLAGAIDRTWGSFDKFKETFSAVAAGHFASGWAWLVADNANKLSIVSTPNQDIPITQGLYPLYVLDVWEHAYYLKWQNRRPDFIAESWSVVNWEAVSERFAKKPTLSKTR